MSILQSKLFRTGAKYSVVSTIKSVVAMVAGMVIMFWLPVMGCYKRRIGFMEKWSIKKNDR